MYDQTLEHSAKGSSWTKKDHKYIRKEGNKYIYPEDIAGSKKSGNGFFARRKKRKELNAKLDQIEKEKETKRRLDAYEIKKQIPGAALTRHETLKKDAEKRMNDREREILYESKRKQAQKQLEDLNRAKKNLRDSPNGKTARDIIKEQGVTKVERNSGTHKETRSVTRKASNGRREVTNTQTVWQSKDHPSGTARDMISKKGTQKVEYKDTWDGRKRIVTNKDYSKTRQNVEKWMGNPDTRNKFKKTASEMKRSISRGKRTVSSLFNKNQRTAEQQIPLNMRLKRDLKKLKKKKQ